MSRQSRSHGPDRYLHWKLTLFFASAGLWLAGLWSGQRWLTGSAIVLLGITLLLRLIPRRGGEDPVDEPP